MTQFFSKRSILISLLTVGIVGTLAANMLVSLIINDGDRNDFAMHRVAHAGGAVDGQIYTNSYEALNANVENGFVYFELDLMYTSDGELVCLHDWGKNFQANFGYRPADPLTLSEFETALESSKYTNCTLADLALWLDENPDVKIITDVRGGQNIAALELVLNEIPNAAKRVIPQVYAPENIFAARDLGFTRVIWTLYRFRGDAQSIQEWVERSLNENIALAITMPKRWARTSLPAQLKALGVSSYVHTVNNLEELSFFKSQSIDEIYTDFLVPN